MVARPIGDEDLTAVWIPLTPADVPALEQILHDADPFVASTIDTANPYCLTDYLQSSVSGGPDVAVVLDRNLVSRIVRLARGELIGHSNPGSDVDRVAAACMAFFITADVLTEPNISLYELAESFSDLDGQDQLQAFRIAEHLHPQAYLEVALGRAAGIHQDVIDRATRLVSSQTRTTENVDLKMPLRHWRRHRCALTQVAFLERSSKSGTDKFRELLDWSIDPGFFDGVAIALAARLFGSSKPPGRLLKSARSQSFQRCLAGIRNAAWDLTYISHWSSMALNDEAKRLWILCTYDRVLRDIARFAVGEDTDPLELFCASWRRSDAERLHKHYCDIWEKAQDSDDRSQSMEDRFANVDSLRLAIERKIKDQIGEQSAG